MRTRTIGLVLLLSSGLVGCAKQSAEKAIARAEQDIAAVRPEAEKVAPVELAVLVDSVAAMKAHVAAGEYSAASRGARNLGLSVRDLRANLGNRRQQLTTGFTATANELPPQLEAVVARVTQLGAMRRLPRNRSGPIRRAESRGPNLARGLGRGQTGLRRGQPCPGYVCRRSAQNQSGGRPASLVDELRLAGHGRVGPISVYRRRTRR